MARSDPQRPFAHLDMQTAYSVGGTSPSLPEDYVRARGRQHPLNARTSEAERIYLAIADYGLHSAVKTLAACARAGIEHIPGLRVRVVAERGFRPWLEQPRELVLLAMDDVGWTNLVQLTNQRDDMPLGLHDPRAEARADRGSARPVSGRCRARRRRAAGRGQPRSCTR